MESSTTQQLMPIEPLQLMQISTKAFSMKGIDYSEDTLNPLVSADRQKNDDNDSYYLNIRMVALIPTGTEGKQIELLFDATELTGALTLLIYFDIDVKEVTDYDAWYLSYQYYMKTADEIDRVQTYLSNQKDDKIKPRKPKRGTVTQVLESW